MELEEAVSKTRKTLEMIGYFIGGIVILVFLLAATGAFEGTWFDDTTPENIEETTNE